MQKLALRTLLFAVLLSASAAVSATQNTPVSAPASESGQVANTATINLNTADAPTLQRELSGIGAAKARAIVAYREAHGDFASIDELLEVKGIGESILETNRDKLSVN